MIRHYFIVLAAVVLLKPNTAHALTVKQFRDICVQHEQCEQLPIIQAYVGGALDLFATLDERSEYLRGINCQKAREKYDVKKITEFMLKASAENELNAMTLFIQYFEKYGECK